VLAVASTVARRFSADDVTFLAAVANVLTAAAERGRTEEATRNATLRDPLTALPNQLLLIDRLDTALRRTARLDSKVAVMVVDLDAFQSVNTSFGHRAGDELLLAVSRRLQNALRPEDTLARLAGDEFVVVCERIDRLATVSVMAARVVATLAEPFVLDCGTVALTASVGIAIGTGRGDDPEGLLRDADLAMYAAKQLGCGRYEFAPDDWTRAQLLA
jgi:diguanylate cyclase (GGDEF)-like protein